MLFLQGQTLFNRLSPLFEQRPRKLVSVRPFMIDGRSFFFFFFFYLSLEQYGSVSEKAFSRKEEAFSCPFPAT